jgi:hypothetical protein
MPKMSKVPQMPKVAVRAFSTIDFTSNWHHLSVLIQKCVVPFPANFYCLPKSVIGTDKSN